MAKSGIISPVGSPGPIASEVAVADPKVSNLGSLALDVLRSQAAGDVEKYLTINLANRTLSVGDAVDVSAAHVDAAAGTMTIAATFAPDQSSGTSRQFSSTDGTGIGHAAIDALIDAEKPFLTLGGLISKVEDEVARQFALGTDISANIVVDQGAGTVTVYTGSVSATQAANVDSADPSETFTQTISTSSGVDKLVFE